MSLLIAKKNSVYDCRRCVWVMKPFPTAVSFLPRVLHATLTFNPAAPTLTSARTLHSVRCSSLHPALCCQRPASENFLSVEGLKRSQSVFSGSAVSRVEGHGRSDPPGDFAVRRGSQVRRLTTWNSCPKSLQVCLVFLLFI